MLKDVNSMKRWFFFSIWILFHRHWRLTGQQWRPSFIPLYHFYPLKHSDIYLQHCMWDDYHKILIALLVFTWLLLSEIHYFIELPIWLIDVILIFVCLLNNLILGFCYSNSDGKSVDSNSHQLSPLHYKWTD